MSATRAFLWFEPALVALVPLVLAQTGRPLTVEEITARVEALAQETGLDDAQRAELTQRWKGVKGLLEAAAASRAQASALLAEQVGAREVAAGRPSSTPMPALPEVPEVPASE